MSEKWNEKAKQISGSETGDTSRRAYEKPGLERHENLRDITFECPDWQCSVTVPAPPAS